MLFYNITLNINAVAEGERLSERDIMVMVAPES